MGGVAVSSTGDPGSRPKAVICADTSVLVRYLVGTPVAKARRAARLRRAEPYPQLNGSAGYVDMARTVPPGLTTYEKDSAYTGESATLHQ